MPYCLIFFISNMKLSFKYKTIVTAVVLSVFSLTFLSCSKLDNNYEPIHISGLNIIHASPTLELLDVYVNNSRATEAEFEFGDKIGYLSAYSGNRTFNVTKRYSPVSLQSLQYTLEHQNAYSLFVVNKLENVEFLMLEDDLTEPAAGNAKIRFINLSPDEGTLNLNVNGATADIVTDKAFKEYSDFEEIEAADQVTFHVKNTASQTTEVTIANVKIEEGKFYTIYAKGLRANTDETRFSAKIFVH